MDDKCRNDITQTKSDEEDNKKEKQVDEEDALSLSDFSLNPNELEKNHFKMQDRRRSSSEPSDFFEFLSDFNSEMISHAEDIIFRGKLVPYGNHHQFHKSLSADDATRFSGRNNRRSARQMIPEIRSNSLTTDRSCSRGSVLDGRNFRRRRNWAKSDEIRRSCSKSSERSRGSTRISRPRWFVLMFGPPRVIRPEMDLQEMKSRRGRRVPRSIFPSPQGGGGIPSGQGGRRGFWGFDLLRVLSCRSHASVAVTAAAGFPPRL